MDVNTKKVVFYTGTALVFAGVIYFGFVNKNKDGLTVYQKLFTNIDDDLSKIDRAVAISIIETASKGQKVPATYDSDYLIARAKAILLKQDTFNVGPKKFNTITGKQVS